VDLVFESKLKDPDFRRSVQDTQAVIFGVKQGDEAAA
jgi:hypothetical protein